VLYLTFFVWGVFLSALSSGCGQSKCKFHILSGWKGGGFKPNWTLAVQNPGRCLCCISAITNFSLLAFLHKALSFIYSYVLNRNVFLMLKVFWLFTQQHKLLVLLPHAAC